MQMQLQVKIPGKEGRADQQRASKGQNVEATIELMQERGPKPSDENSANNLTLQPTTELRHFQAAVGSLATSVWSEKNRYIQMRVEHRNSATAYASVFFLPS